LAKQCLLLRADTADMSNKRVLQLGLRISNGRFSSSRSLLRRYVILGSRPTIISFDFRERFVDAPVQFRAISNEIMSLPTVLLH
jgi:hypothetical protein